MTHRTILSIAILMLFCCGEMSAQQKKNVLFLGNSYTSVNNLPKMIADVSISAGDTLTYSSNTPGGCTLKQHCFNQSMEKICEGGWDAVVIQEQSQYPAFPDWQVEQDVFPYAKRLVDSVYAYSPCAEPLFYMTWGHKYGDQFNAEAFPPLGTYEGMDSLLALRYRQMADSNDASLCPVGRVWHWLRDNHSEIELYQNDNSHPSVAGSYAAACAFYTLIFKKDPLNITYIPSMSPTEADVIRMAVKQLVYDSLEVYQRPNPEVEAIWSDTVKYMSESVEVNVANVDTIYIDWGDGSDSIFAAQENNLLQHKYSDTLAYQITLKASRHCMDSTISWTFKATRDLNDSIDTTEPEGVVDVRGMCFEIRPNPTTSTVQITTDDRPMVVEIITTSGIVVRRLKMENQTETIDVSDIPSGIYMIRASLLDKYMVRRLVVQH